MVIIYFFYIYFYFPQSRLKKGKCLIFCCREQSRLKKMQHHWVTQMYVQSSLFVWGKNYLLISILGFKSVHWYEMCCSRVKYEISMIQRIPRFIEIIIENTVNLPPYTQYTNNSRNFPPRPNMIGWGCALRSGLLLLKHNIWSFAFILNF